MKHRKKIVLVLTICILILGCTGGKFIVKKNPSDTDEGFRYYLPKPYLLVANKIDENTKSIVREAKIIYLPDIEEKYSITVIGGTTGSFDGSLKLEDGWKLTQVDQKFDAKIAETITALSSLVKELKLKELKPTVFELYEIDLKNRRLIPLEIPIR